MSAILPISVQIAGTVLNLHTRLVATGCLAIHQHSAPTMTETHSWLWQTDRRTDKQTYSSVEDPFPLREARA